MHNPDVSILPAVMNDLAELMPPPALLPQLSNFLDPTTTDLLTWARHMEQLTNQCNVTAGPGEPDNPYAFHGAMRVLTHQLRLWLQQRVSDEERSLQLLDRLTREAAEEPRDPPYDGRDAATGIALHGEI